MHYKYERTNNEIMNYEKVIVGLIKHNIKSPFVYHILNSKPKEILPS